MASNTFKENLIELIDFFPFLANEKSKYCDSAVLSLLRENPGAARIRHSFRCGVGTVRPLALVVALGASLEVVKLLVEACPEALYERISGRRTPLHYACASGASAEIINYIAINNPSALSQRDTFHGIPLHAASTYTESPSSLPVLRRLLRLYPKGASSLDNKSQTPLHRACKSRASLDKIMVLVEAFPDALFWTDQRGNSPLGWAERMDHSLAEFCPDVVEFLEMTMEILKIGCGENTRVAIEESKTMERPRAQQILSYLCSLGWNEGIAMLFARNHNLFAILDIPFQLVPDIYARLGSTKSRGDVCAAASANYSTLEPPMNMPDSMSKYGMASIFSILKQQPEILCAFSEITVI